MSSDRTMPESGDDRRRAQELSTSEFRPPAEIAGYELRKPLGAGTYGEVWVGLDLNTGREVAIKFFAHCGGLDFPLLTREVEKLAFLAADRHVVQLLDVGWDADPPYYVMEYVDRGSLQDALEEHGTFLVPDSLKLFRDIAIGVMHAHGKGILHCDLKPSNVLLDQDVKPRLADFGQARLAQEQNPALGTLFYMAPEQADLRAIPDVRWDVYALGAVWYWMLVGRAPYQSHEAVEQLASAVDLEDRLARYRACLSRDATPNEHRRVHDMSRELADVISRCLATNPKDRYASVQTILEDIDRYERRRALRPLMLFGAIGPVLLLLITVIFAVQGFGTAIKRSDDALVDRALESNGFAASFVAATVADELDRRFRIVEELADDRSLQRHVEAVVTDAELSELLRQLADPQEEKTRLEPLRESYRALGRDQPSSAVGELFGYLERAWDGLTRVGKEGHVISLASLFVNDAHGNQIARWPHDDTIGRNYARRTYFHGGAKDKEDSWRVSDDEGIITETRLSTPFMSQATDRWIVAVSAPIRPTREGAPLGIVAMTFEIGKIVELPRAGAQIQGPAEQFPVIVDWRQGDQEGMVLHHPIFSKWDKLPDRFSNEEYRMTQSDFEKFEKAKFKDPFEKDGKGAENAKSWIAEVCPVRVRNLDTGWVVIVQQSYDEAIGGTLQRIKSRLATLGGCSLGLFVLVVLGMWGMAFLRFRGQRREVSAQASGWTDSSGTARAGGGTAGIDKYSTAG